MATTQRGMQGFDAEWRDLPHFIVGITERIWEERDVTSLRRYYSDDVFLRLTTGLRRGNARAAQEVLSTLVEHPDGELLPQDVIWCGTAEDGMLSSHRSLTVATHGGDGPMGPATGRRIRFRTVADCWAKDNMIRDAWIVRDNGGIARQLGVEPRDMAARMIEDEGGPGKAAPAFTPETDEPGPYQGSGNDDEWGACHADLMTRLMDGDMRVVSEVYDRAVTLELPGNVSADGRSVADRFWIRLRSAFPNAEFKIHHVVGREDPMMPPRSALRWSLDGLHEGWDLFGRPTGARVHVMGISHAEWRPWGLRREWVSYDELAIWRQILMHQG